MKIYNFNNPNIFAELEDKAIDGQLNYDDFPANEYKYFSKLAQLGYKNRHAGLSIEICKIKQNEYKKQYYSDIEHQERFFNAACHMQKNIKLGEMLISKVYKSNTDTDRLHFALMALEKITCEDGLEERISNKDGEENE